MQFVKFYLLTLLFLSFEVLIHAAGRDAFQFLLLAPGARAGAIGESYVAVAEGAESVVANPSGLANETRSQVSFQHLSFVEGILYHNFLYVRPTVPLKGTWAVQVGYLGVGGFSRTVADPAVVDGFRETGDFSTYDLVAGVSFGRKIAEGFSVGSGAHFIRESLSDAAANGFAFDLGFLYREKNSPVQFGFAFQHLGPDVKYKDEQFSLPKLLCGGISVKNPKNSAVVWFPKGSIITGEMVRLFSDGELSVRGGFELPFFEERFFLRSGYQHSFKSAKLGSTISLPNGFSFGIGFGPEFWKLDYALSSIGELGLAHRISLSFWFGSGHGKQS